MTHIVTSKEMKSYDKYTIDKMGVPSMVLMEHAAQASVEELLIGGFDTNKVLCVCGTGNNGGDGFAVARLLHLKKINVEILFIGEKEKCSEETLLQFTICENYGITVYSNDISIIAKRGYTSVIDAVFGIGLVRNIKGTYQKAIDAINFFAKKDMVKVLAIDIPSGISTDTGDVMGTAVKADKTVTFAYNKIGLTIGDGPRYAGDITIKDIGIYSPEDLDCLTPPEELY